MTLTERFVGISAWQTSRKTTLWILYLVIIHAVATAIFTACAYFGAIGEVILPDRFLQFLLLWITALLICLGLSAACSRLGWEGRWTAYLLVATYSGFTAALIHGTGSASSPNWAMAISVVFTSTIFWDRRVGMFAFVCIFTMIVIVQILELQRVLPYAPLLSDRGVDAHLNLAYIIFLVSVYLPAAFICMVTIGLVVSAMQLQQDRADHAQGIIRRYLPAQVVDSILSGQTHLTEGHQRKKLTVFFSDIVGFTEMSEALEPEDLSQVLDGYFTAMTRVANHHGGTIDELSGDAILIFFGAPAATTDHDHARNAVQMALEMQTSIRALNQQWAAKGIPVEIQVRMGINTGVVTVGNFGSSERRKYAALGRHVNLAARIQAYCAPGSILISQYTWLLVRDDFSFSVQGEQNFKGIAKPVKLFQVIGEAGAVGTRQTAVPVL